MDIFSKLQFLELVKLSPLLYLRENKVKMDNKKERRNFFVLPQKIVKNYLKFTVFSRKKENRQLFSITH